MRTQEQQLRLTDSEIRSLSVPATGNRIHYDSIVKGFGVRITAAGTRSFVLNYRTRAGRERRYTIGRFPNWKASAARDEAARIKTEIDRGGDPLAELDAQRAAPTVADLCERYEKEHLPKKRLRSGRDDRQMIARHIRPGLKHKRVSEVTFTDIDDLHRKISAAGTPIRANRVIALISKMFSLAVRWGWRSDNPAKGIERNQEQKRDRYLSKAELNRLISALSTDPDRQAANIFRFLLLTGARSGEVKAAKWSEFDLTSGVWVKPGSTTKQKTEHRVPLSAPARQLLTELYSVRNPTDEYVFAAEQDRHRIDTRRAWARICEAAGIRNFRVHDLRHTYASVLASANISLPTIGALLGHSQPQTTARYSHLFDDPLRAATDTVGALFSSLTSAQLDDLK